MGVSLTSVYDFLSTNGSFVVFTSLLSRYDDFWPLLAGFPEGTTVSSGPEEVVGRRLARRQEVEPLGNYTVLAPTDEAFSLMFDNITYARILQDPYANPFWKYVVTYHVLNGSYVLPEEVSAGDGAAHLRCVDGYSTVLVTKADEGDGYLANSAPVYDSEPVRTGNGYVYPIGKLIWPGDYFPLANGRHADIPWVLGIAAQENGAVEE
ncbi:hypothetical protein DFJ74DRAFT_674743 [Hyaloraphidium curvatum]|nr:hypothetical protein DFJ74DRAFT_674743 [Hyaloraphidium curvatum]